MYPLHRAVSRRLSFAIAIVIAIWSALFYFAVMDEVNDEVDDALENYSEILMLRALRGETLPSESIGSNNEYFFREVSAGYAATHDAVRYEDREVYIKEKRETEPARVYTQIYRTHDGRYMELEVSVPTIEKRDLQEAIALWLTLLYVGLMLAVFTLNYIGLHRAMRPLHRLLTWLDHYRLGEKNPPLDNPTKISEFRRLNESATSTLARSELLHAQQRQFLGNASHELQTPLAICQNRIELLLDDEGLSEEQMGELLKIRRTLADLSRLNRSLLLLCKIEGGSFTERKPIAFADLLDHLLPDFRSAYPDTQTVADIDRASAPQPEMDESLAAALLTNLLRNAYVHNRPGGSVRIALKDNSLVVSNTGENDAPLDAEAIFCRFYHTPGRAASTGLGLPIVRAICERYGLRIEYSFEQDLHTFIVMQEN